MSHTKEPWAQFESDKRAIVEAGNPMLSLLSIDEDGLGIFFEDGDAERVVACVNACAGISTDSLEQEGSAVMGWQRTARKLIAAIKQRDDLAEQVECSTITKNNMEARLNGWLVKYATMKDQRDELLAALEQFLDPEGDPPEDTGEWREVLRVIASVKGGAI